MTDRTPASPDRHEPTGFVARLLDRLGLRSADRRAAVEARQRRDETRDRAKQEWRDGRGPPTISGG